MRKVSGLGLTLILVGALLVPSSSSMANEKFNWKIKKEETRRSTAGYSDSMSYAVGASIEFKVSCPATDFYIEAVRIGYYEGDQGKRISQSKKFPCLDQSRVDSKQWKVNAQVNSTSFPHGMYLFIIRDSDD